MTTTETVKYMAKNVQTTHPRLIYSSSESTMDERSVLTPARRGASHIVPNTMKTSSLPDDSEDAKKALGKHGLAASGHLLLPPFQKTRGSGSAPGLRPA